MLATYTFGDVMWTMFVFFAWILFFWMLFGVFGDLFSRHDISGWAKAGWTLFVIILPFLGIFVYLISQGKAMGERAQQRAQAQQAEVDTYVRSVASSGSPTEEIAKGKELLESGAITQTEFDQLKAKARSLRRQDPRSSRRYRPSRVRRRMPRRFCTARSFSPSFFAAQMKAQATTTTVNTLAAAITIPRKVLIPAA